jgi:hypothetical protein
MIAVSFVHTNPHYRECLSHDQCPSARCARRPSHHVRKRGVPVHRLPGLSAGHDPLDGSRAPAQERGLDRQDHQDLRSPGRALDRQPRQRPGGRRFRNSPSCWQTTSRWTGRRSTRGRTSNSFRPSTPPAAASSSSAPCGPKCAWPSPPSTRCATGMRSIPSSTRSPAPRPRPTGPALIAWSRLRRSRGALQPERVGSAGRSGESPRSGDDLSPSRRPPLAVVRIRAGARGVTP